MGNGNFVESAEEVKRKELDRLRKQGKTAAELAAAEKTLGPAGRSLVPRREDGPGAMEVRRG